MTKERTFGMPVAALYVTLVANGIDLDVAMERTVTFQHKFGNMVITEETLREVGAWIKDGQRG